MESTGARRRMQGACVSDKPLGCKGVHNANNQLCGVNSRAQGTYTAEGITKLCKALKGSAVTSLKCATAPRACLSVNAR